MKFGIGIPAWLGALLVVGLPAAVAGIITGGLEKFVPGWVLPIAGIISFVLSCIVWLAFVTWMEKRHDKKKDKANQAKHD